MEDLNPSEISKIIKDRINNLDAVSYTHLRAHET